MTPPESPSSLLERAAQRLEALADEAWNEPWRANRRVISFEVQLSASPPFGFEPVADVGVEGNAAWIATMYPAIAAPLCELLRGSMDHPSPAAVSLARAILGEPVPGEDSP